MKERAMQFLRDLLKTTMFKRRAFFLVADILLIAFSMYASFWIRFDGKIPYEFSRYLREYIILSLAVKLCFLMYYDMYGISWRFFSLGDLLKLFRAVTLSSVSLGLLLFFLKTYAPFRGFPRSILLLDYIFTVGFIGTLRISKRAVQEFWIRTEKQAKGKSRVLIIGAGSAGEQIGREMLNNKKSRYYPVGYIDDDPAKRGISIHGIKVLGTREDIPRVLETNRVEEVLVAIPSVSSKEIRKIVEIIRKSNQVDKIKILPGIADLMDGNVTLSDIQEVKIEDLLGREPVEIDFRAIRDFLSGKRVLITGAGGSIGSELSRTVRQFEPKSLVLLDIDETELFLLLHRLRSESFEIVPVIGDINDKAKMGAVFEKYRPEIVIHSAAYKHVPMLEYYPEDAVKTNVNGTKILAGLAMAHGVDKFVYISTDKAINPTSIMGSTKRVGEEMLRILNRRNKTRFICVRFGNVLRSRGSVTEIFKDQIKRGGPVTVTHPEMKRYFMAPSEAVLLVLEAEIFRLYKFKTMKDSRDEFGKLLPDEKRITQVGNFFRKFSLDELPELFNVLKGDMSLVGPRPLLVKYLSRYTSEQARRHGVKPGIMGWAQVNGRNAITWEEKFKLDVWYVDHMSFWLDIKILLLTLWKTIKREGINPPGQATMEEFLGSQGGLK